MPKRNSKHEEETLEELLERPWCYYCKRDFNDVKVLVDHQKNKHFICQVGHCNRKLNTVGGLRVHMQQVHKEELHEVPNAVDGRKDISLEIFGIVGIPPEVVQQRKEAIEKSYADRERDYLFRTGNPLPGSARAQAQAKQQQDGSKRQKLEQDSKEDIKRKLQEAKARREAQKAAQAAGLPINGTSGQNTPAIATNPTPPAMYGMGAPPPGDGFDSTPPFAAPGNSSLTPGAYGGGMFHAPGIYGAPGPFSSSSPPLPMPFAPPGVGAAPMPYHFPDMSMAGAPGPYQAPANFGAPVPMPPRNQAVEDMIDAQYKKINAAGQNGRAAKATSPAPATKTEQVEKTEKSKKAKSKAGQLLTDDKVSWEEKRARNPRYRLKPKASTVRTYSTTQATTGVVDTADALYHIG